MRQLLTLAMAIAAVVLAHTALAEPPSDEDFRKLLDEQAQALAQWMREQEGQPPSEDMMEKVRAYLDDLYRDLPLEELTMRQLDVVVSVSQYAPSVWEVAHRRYTDEAGAPTMDGAIAAMRVFQHEHAEARLITADALRPLLRHRGVRPLLQDSDLGGMFLGLIASAPLRTLRECKKELLLISAHLTPEVEVHTAADATSYYRVILELGDDFDLRKRERIRGRVIAALDHAVSLYMDLPRTSMAEYLDVQRAWIDGTYARGELIGNPAPDPDLYWHALPMDGIRLSDLRGKVVVLVVMSRSTSNLNQVLGNLDERFRDQDVVILGVAETASENGPTEADQRLIDQQIQFGFRWPVAFFRPEPYAIDFGCSGEGQLVIIDPDGVVRNAIHPRRCPEQDLESRIDRLLLEVGLVSPRALLTRYTEEAIRAMSREEVQRALQELAKARARARKLSDDELRWELKKCWDRLMVRLVETGR